MPIDTQNLMPRLSPLAPLEPMQFGGASSLERQKLKLMKQQFEEAKRQHLEDERLRAISEQGEMRRAEMQMERERMQNAAAAALEQQKAAALLAAKQREHAETAYGDVFKAREGQDFAGMSAAAERLRQHGGLAEDMGVDEQGRPSFRLGVSAAEYQKQQAQRDAQSAAQPLAPGATDESLPQSLSRLSALGYDTTTEGVVDTGALQDQTLRQLRPALDSYRQSFPEGQYQDSVGSSNDAAAALAGSPAQGLELAQKLGSAPQAAIAKELDAERDLSKEERDARRAMSKEERAALRAEERAGHAYAKQGRADAAKLWETNGLNKALEKRKAADQVIELLDNDNHLDDDQIGHLYVNLKGSVGPQSDTELAAVFGESDMSLLEWGEEKFRNWWAGGKNPGIKKTLISIVKRSIEMDDDKVRAYLDSAASTLASPETSPEAKRGWRQFLDTVDPSYREAHSKYRKEAGEPTLEELAEQQKTSGGGMRGSQMSAPADGSMGEVRIPESKRIAYVHNNPGNLKYAGQEGAEQGEEAKAPDGSPAGHWARFPSVEAGLNALRDQVMRDAERGLSIRDFIMKYAPPTDNNDTERYIEDAVEALKAESGDDALAETDPYDVVRFIAMKESSTVLPSQYDAEEDAEEEAPATAPAASQSAAKPAGKPGKHDDWSLLE